MAAEPGELALQWAVDVPTPAGIFGPDGQFDAVAAGRVLGQLLAGAPVHGPFSGAVLLPGVSLRVRRLQTAATDQGALKRILADDSELRVPGVPVEGLHHAVYSLRDTPAGTRGDAGRSLVAAAARRDVIRAYSLAGASAGIDPLRVAAPAVSLANLHRALHPAELDEPVLLIHVGSLRSELVVVHGGAPLLSLPLVQGIDQLFDAVRGGSSDGVDPDVLLRETGEPVPALEDWVARVRGSHRTAMGAAERHLRRSLQTLPVRLSGGIARYDVVVERLGAAIAAPVGVLDPAERFPHAASADVFGPALVLALGAALEARDAVLQASTEAPAESELIPLNLAVLDAAHGSRGVRPALLALVRDRAVWGALLAAAILAFLLPMGMESRLETGERDVAAAREAFKADAAAVAADSVRLSALQADSARLAGTLGTLATLEANRYAWPRLMHGAAQALPAFAWLEGLEMEAAEPGAPVRVHINAIAPTQADVSRYERRLADAGDIGDTSLERSESLAAGPFALVGFRLGGALAPPTFGDDQPRPGGAGYNDGLQAASSAPEAP